MYLRPGRSYKFPFTAFSNRNGIPNEAPLACLLSIHPIIFFHGRGRGTGNEQKSKVFISYSLSYRKSEISVHRWSSVFKIRILPAGRDEKRGSTGKGNEGQCARVSPIFRSASDLLLKHVDVRAVPSSLLTLFGPVHGRIGA